MVGHAREPSVATKRDHGTWSVSAIAKALGISRATLYRHLTEDV
ncbi:helix-turn-helix domain-containing protein [Streptomyces sp. NPDC059851]